MKLKTSPFPFRVNKLPFFYGWVILIAGTVGVLMSIPGQTMGISVFTDPLIDSLGIERTSLSLAYMLGTIASGLLITRAGKYYDIYGARIMAMLAGFMLGIILIILSRVDVIIIFFSSLLKGTNYELIAIIILVIGFFGLRFFGQGILTMISRNMVMKWFEKRRGLANALMGVFVSFGFSYAPRLFNNMIDGSNWKLAWQEMGIFVGIGFVIFAIVFFRDNAKDCGLQPDGINNKSEKKKNSSKSNIDYTLKEARRKYSFWVFNLSFALNALFVTAITFHIVSIFNEAGYDQTMAISIFLPASFIAVSINFIGGWLSDYIRLKYLLMVNMLGLVLASWSLIQLESQEWAYWGLIIGNGIISGIFSVVNTVTWPRFFGTKHLGGISGYAMSWTVIASAVGPHLFSSALKYTGVYTTGIAICMSAACILFIMAIRANNVQE